MSLNANYKTLVKKLRTNKLTLRDLSRVFPEEIKTWCIPKMKNKIFLLTKCSYKKLVFQMEFFLHTSEEAYQFVTSCSSLISQLFPPLLSIFVSCIDSAHRKCPATYLGLQKEIIKLFIFYSS